MAINPQPIPKENLQAIIDAWAQVNKPGKKTTEFWTALIAAVTSTLTGLFSYAKTTATDWTQFIPIGIVLLIIFLVFRQYNIGRAEVKKATAGSMALPNANLTATFQTKDDKTVTIQNGIVTSVK